MTTSADATMLELRGANDTGVRVVFERANDRWSHAIEALAQGTWVRLLESVEGNGADAWPASPPLQNLHFEERDDKQRVALAVGMAGRSHWSASIEADAVTREIRFDIACRSSVKPEFLGTTYRTCGGPAIELAVDEMQLRAAGVTAVVRLTAVTIRRLGDDSFSLSPVTPPASYPATARWQFAIDSHAT